MKKAQFILSILLSSIIIQLNAQQYFDFGFERDHSIQVNDSLGNPLDMAWVGGLNAVHFQEMDLNLDGIMDIVVYDVQGSRLLTFINNGTANTIDYTYAPEYEKLFPEIYSWMQTVDFDNDGDMDIFNYSTYGAGISVYENISSNGVLKFKLLTQSLYYSIPGWPSSNIYVSTADYPAIVDVDNDGDIDILTFSILGVYIHYYKNFSMENYGVPDSLEYKLADQCWGKFAENDTSNEVKLHQYCYNGKIAKSSGGVDKSGAEKHTGSTLLAMDLNGDTLMDLLLGDVDYFTINGLINGGTLDSAHMIAQDTTYPNNTQAIDVVSFPVAKYIDIDNDSIKELIVSPFDPLYYSTKNRNSVWLYDNNGTNSLPAFSLAKKGLLQDEMIDVGDASNPSLVDVDGDGLLDLIISNYGFVDSTYIAPPWYILHAIKISQLTYYKNIGTAGNPKYQFMTSDWAGLSALKKIALRATFGDLDGDGDDDMLVGSNDGSITYYENIAGAGQNISFAAPITNFQNISVGKDNFSSPQLIDIDKDNLLDLVIGKKTNRLRTYNNLDSTVGYISYYKNTGSASQAVFTLETDSMGNINPRDFYSYYAAYASPYFFRDADDSLKLYVGSASGLTFYYRNIENNIHGTFGVDSNLTFQDVNQTLYSVFSYNNSDHVLVPFRMGIFSAPLVHDFNTDGYPDMMIGAMSGGLCYFKGVKSPGVGFDAAKNINEPVIKLFPNPANDIVNIKLEDFQNIQSMNIEIRDMTGRLISSKRSHARPNTQISTSNLKQGVYFISIYTKSYGGQEFNSTLKLMIL